MEIEIDSDSVDMIMMIGGWSRNRFLDGCVVEMESEDESNDHNECRVRVKLSDFDCIGLLRWYDCGIG